MDNKKEAIIQTSLALFERDGFDNVSMKQIFDACNIAKGTFYYHFDSKDDVILCIYDNISSHIIEVMPQITQEPNFKDKVWIVIKFWLENTLSFSSQFIKTLIQIDTKRGLKYFSPLQRSDSDMQRCIYEMNIELIKQGQKQGTITDRAPAELILETLVAAITNILMDRALYSETDEEFQNIIPHVRKIFDFILAP
jgi:AcrR family transcriptional regulator